LALNQKNSSANTPSSVSEQLISICGAPVDQQTRSRAALHLLDWLGCVLAAQRTEPGNAITGLSVLKQFSSGDCFTCGQSDLGAMGAAFVNGGLGNILEMDDVHRASILHAGDTVIPSVLATAQAQHTSINTLLDSIVQGYELAIRLGSVAAKGGYSNWYNSGTCGVFGAAFGSGQVLKLNPAEQKDCLGQAGMLASGIWQCRFEPTWSKQLATANAASNAVIAAYLGQQAFPGPRFILEGEAGFFSSYYPNADLRDLNLDPAENWLLHQVSFKPWPACRHTHPAIEAALKIHHEHDLANIDSVEIETYQAAIDFCDNPTPISDHEARFSLQHCVAVALLNGDPSITDFERNAREQKSISDLRNKITLKVGEPYQQRFPASMSAAIRVKDDHGSDINVGVDHAKGDPENPLSISEIKDKFLSLAAFGGVNYEIASSLVRLLLTDKDENLAETTSSDKQSLVTLSEVLAQISQSAA